MERFVIQLAGLADVYVNDAFGSWQSHASTYHITKFLPSYAGLCLQVCIPSFWFVALYHLQVHVLDSLISHAKVNILGLHMRQDVLIKTVCVCFLHIIFEGKKLLPYIFGWMWCECVITMWSYTQFYYNVIILQAS